VHTPEAFEALLSYGTESSFTPGTTLWREGDASGDVLLLLHGVLEVTHRSPEGGEVVLRRLDAGAVVGEIGSLEGGRRTAAVRAATRARVLSIPALRFREVMRAQPELLEELFWQQVNRVRTLTESVVSSHRPSIVDALTRTYNPPFFRERLRQELERAREIGDDLAVAAFDVDHLAAWNEAHGHEGGNELLASVADLIRATGRRGDVLARLGGGTFAVLLYGATRDDGARFAEKVRARIEGHAFPGAETQPGGRITVSAAVSCCPDDGTRVDILMESADLNLARAKERGRNRVVADAARD
jgi:diguanylate cyclase (GGDEF)-like protein